MKTFKSFEEAALIATDESKMDTPEWHAAINYCIIHAPPEVLAELMAFSAKYFPNITPEGYDDAGNAYFSLDKIKQELGLSDADVEKIMRENGIEFSSNIKINLVQ